MNLATVVNPEFANHAIQLIRTYRMFYDGKVTVYFFGGACKDIGADSYVEIPHLCAHSHKPDMYFYKTYAIYHMMQQLEPFIYLDSRHRFLSYPYEIHQALDKYTRFFVEYPKLPVNGTLINIENLTTQTCLEHMGCNIPRYKEAPMYWAAIQAWTPTQENMQFAKEFLDMMMDPKIAGPSNRLEYPEGRNGCKAHRNDQSVLSVLIEKYNWQQPYTDSLWAKYGDADTIQTAIPQPVIKGRCNANTILSITSPRKDWSQKIGAVISFCTNDLEFFDPCVQEAQQFADEIVISYGDKFFDGKPEHHDIIDNLRYRYPTVKFVEFPIIQTADARRNHNIQRYAGMKALGNVDYVMFIDTDEIIEAKKFKVWWKEKCEQPARPVSMRLATYYYFYSPSLRADEIDQSAIIVHKPELDKLSQKFFYELNSERDTLLKYFKGYEEFITDSNNDVMSHHYCLVRTKEELLKKAQMWGHKGDKDWLNLIERFFTQLSNPAARDSKYLCRCIVVHAHQKQIRYDGTKKMVLRPCTPVELVLSSSDRTRLRSEGCDVLERGYLERENGPIVDFWHGFEYSLVEPYLHTTKYTTDHKELTRLFGLDQAAIDKTEEIS